MMGPILLLQLFAALLMSVRAVIVVNRMGPNTCRAYSIGWIATGGAAASFVASTLAGQTPADLHTALLLAAVATVLVLDKRRR